MSEPLSQIEQGTQLLEDGKRREALEFFNLALSMDPTSSVALSKKGKILLVIGSYKEARECLQKALSLDPSHPDAHLDKAIIGKDSENALELIEEAIKATSKPTALHHYYKTYVLYFSAKYEEAFSSIKQAIELRPSDPLFHAFKSEILSVQNKIDEALESAKKAQSLDPNFADGYLSEGISHYKKSDQSKALELYEKGLIYNPSKARLHSNKALIFYIQGREKEALELIDKALSLEPSFRTYRSKGLVLMGIQKYPEALEAFNNAISMRPIQADLWCKKGDILNKMGKTEEALECFRKSKELIDTNPASRATLSENYIRQIDDLLKSAFEFQVAFEQTKAQVRELDKQNPQVQTLLTKIQDFDQKKDQLIKKMFNEYDKNNKNELEQYNKEVMALKKELEKEYDRVKPQQTPELFSHIEKGTQLLENAKRREALEFFNLALSIDPTSSVALSKKGKILLVIGSYKEARECLQKALSLDPSHPDAHLDKAIIGKDSENALELIEEAIKATSKPTALHHYYKAYVLYFSAKYEEAFSSIKQAIELRPSDPLFHAFKSEILSVQNKTDEALESAKKAQSLDPNFADGYLSEGLLYYKKSDQSKALELFEKGLIYNPSKARLHSNKALILYIQGREREALELIDKALSLEPSFLTYRSEGLVLMGIQRYPEALELKSSFELQAAFDKTKAHVDELILQETGQQNPQFKNFVEKMKMFRQQKDNLTNEFMDQYDKNDKTSIDKYKKDLLEKIESDVQSLITQVETLNKNFEELKIEISTKMDYFAKKIELALSKLDLSSDDITTIKQYFNGFVGTFSSSFVTSQVIESGQVKLDAGSSIASVLSVAASFAPFMGGALSSGISSMSEFLKSKEMKTNARKVMNLANDSSDLSQLVGGVAHDLIVQNSNKRSQIMKITDEDLESKSKDLFQLVLKFCCKLNQKGDVYLYGNLYKSPAAKLGHIDANRLLEYWVKEDRNPIGIKSTFTKILKEELEPKEAQSSNSTEPPTGLVPVKTKTARCNMF